MTVSTRAQNNQQDQQAQQDQGQQAQATCALLVVIRATQHPFAWAIAQEFLTFYSNNQEHKLYVDGGDLTTCPRNTDGSVDHDEVHAVVELLTDLGFHVIVNDGNDSSPIVVYWHAATVAHHIAHFRSEFPDMVHFPATGPLHFFDHLHEDFVWE
jgi:hypothetical protein